MTPKQFETWLLRAEPGEPLVYHSRGNLAHDREHNPMLDALASAAWSASEAGFVTLCQFKRQFVGAYDYLAIRTGEIAG